MFLVDVGQTRESPQGLDHTCLGKLGRMRPVREPTPNGIGSHPNVLGQAFVAVGAVHLFQIQNEIIHKTSEGIMPQEGTGVQFQDG